MALLPSGLAKTGVVPYQIYPKTIDQSLRIDSASSASLIKPASEKGTATDTTKCTFSAWIKRGNFSATRTIFIAGTLTNNTFIQFVYPDEYIYFRQEVGGSLVARVTTPSFYARDPSAWYHLVVAYDSNEDQSINRVKFWINGVEITDKTEVGSNPIDSARANNWFHGSYTSYLGTDTNLATNRYEGYLAEVHGIDGTAYTADDFGELRSGIWVPKEVDVTYGANGFHLPLASSDLNVTGSAIDDPYGSATQVPDDYFADASGSGNHWQIQNLGVEDVVPDSPTNNFAVLNPLEDNTGSSATLALREGNLRSHIQNNPGDHNISGTFAPTSGKWYWEQYVVSMYGSQYWSGISQANLYAVRNFESGVGYRAGGVVRINGVDDATGLTTYATGDIVGIAVDMDGGTIDFYVNGGSSVYQATLPSSITDNGFKPNTANGTTGGDQVCFYNFGQDSTFAGTLSAGGNTDANGIGDFAYAPPSGYLALCTSNLLDPVIDPAQEATADQHFNVYTYTGNGASQLIGDVVREIPDTVTIDQSLRFDHAGSTYLTFDPASDGDTTEWTFSTWFKRTGADARMIFGQGTNGSNNRDIIYLEAAGELQVASYGGSYVFQFVTDRIFNDSAAWYHLVVAYDSSQATDTDRVKIWVNGLLITNFSTNTKPNLNDPCFHFNSGSPQYIGRYIDQGTHWNGYQAETHWIDGTAYAATDFGAYNADGVWTPITPSVTYGTNGWHIDYSSASYTDNALDPDTFADQANSNDFSAYGIEAEDIVPDTPTNQFAVLDSNRKPAHVTLTEGNLVSTVSTAGWETFKSAIGFEKGKWYWEIKLADDGRQFVGVMHEPSDAVDIADVYYRTTGLWNVYYNGDMYLNSGSFINNGNTFGTDDIMSIAFDADTGQFWLGENGTWYNSGDPASGTNELFTIPTTERIFPTGSVYYTASRQRWNFGADATFAGDDTGSAGPYSDDNSVGEFYYQPPTGFLALCENNLIQYDDNPLESPDFVWIKNREQTDAHQWYDSVRGIYQDLHSDLASDESTTVTGLTGFHKNGFTIGDNVAVNTYGEDYVAWAWKAGGTASTIAAGAYSTGPDVPSIASTVSANTDAGFSIVSYTGNNTAGATVGHGLSSAPEMIIVKERTNDGGWWSVYHKDSTATGTAADTYIQLDQAGASASWNGWDDTAPTASVFSLGSYDDVNGPSDTYIAYCFHSVDGFSKVGSYVGNGNANGTFVYTGFRPKWIMVKSTTNVSNPYMGWCIIDAETMSFNADEQGTQLWANAAYIQGTRGNGSADATVGNFDLLSNGFKLRSNLVEVNYSGQQYIYLAFAEQPFKYSNAR